MRNLILIVLLAISAEFTMISAAFASAATAVRDPARVILPKNYTKLKKWPIVILLHGYKVSGEFQMRYFGLKSRLNKKEFILWIPGSTRDSKGNRFWNATEFCCDHFDTQVDDVGYIENGLREIKSRYSIDSNRVYVLGHSAGGFLAHRLACELSDQITAIASLAGANFKNPAFCRPNSAVSVLQIHGTDDDTVLFEGNTPEILARPQGNHHYPGRLALYPSAQETVNFWRQANRCDASIDKEIYSRSLIFGFGGPTIKQTSKNCSADTEVALWTLDQVGHVPILTGKTKDAILDFLLQKRKHLF